MATTAPARPFSTHLRSLSSRNFLNGTSFIHHQESKNKTKNTTTLSLKSTSFQPIAALPFNLSPPPIDHDLLDKVKSAGAGVSENGIVETFGNDDESLDAVENGVAVVDLSHFGRIRVSGDDRIQLLHNQSTANFENLRERQGCDTVFITPTARTIDIAHAWFMKNSIMLVVSPLTCGSISDMLNKFIFFADKVEIQDITKQTSLFILLGPKSNTVMSSLNLSDLVGQAYGTHRHYSVNGILLSLGTILMGSNAWEKLRVIQGRPTPGKELTNEFNILEAGLWNSVSLNKGCYKGQETVSKLITYGVKQRLWGICLSAPVEPDSAIMVDGKKVGKLTEEKSLIILV
ncbi:putative transferase At1g60990, chloroplastic isoform X2 [Pistacia vera]|uniref:putative transferase At1g60990, chloroplastic isoform X2 n=1 Tax=Pistacia vera TaxID=55513 RepID=UPI001262CCA8|nr:putative transferase At1g60990, chloroplastic isoform X2 [Pistacia vera]